MITIIHGPQGSGKTELANAAFNLADKLGLPKPIIIDDAAHQLENPTKEFISNLQTTQMAGLHNIFLVQTTGDCGYGAPDWLHDHFEELYFVDVANLYKPTTGSGK